MTWADATSEFAIALTGVGARSVNRELRISRAGSTTPTGVFRVRPVLSGTNALLYDGLTTSASVPVSDFEYSFKIAADCSACVAADFNNDSSTDPDDLADYINAFFTVPPPI